MKDPMKWLLATVGTSAIYNEDLGRAPNYRDNRALMGRVSRFKGAADQTVSGNEALFNDLFAAHREFWKAPEVWKSNRRHRRQTSAELISTRTLLEWRQFEPERICLLASDTAEGEFAAELNLRVMREVLGRRDVEARRVPGLDVRMEGIFETLQQFFAKTLRIDDRDAVQFNVTGGYKGTVPMLTLIAERRKWSLFYQHEDYDEAVCLLLDGGNPKIEVTAIWDRPRARV
jgi:putative CRISPR-associated protein (TIGR02619 family)